MRSLQWYHIIISTWKEIKMGNFWRVQILKLLPIFLLDQLNEGDKGVIIYTIRFHYSQVKELERALKEGLGPQMLMK